MGRRLMSTAMPNILPAGVAALVLTLAAPAAYAVPPSSAPPAATQPATLSSQSSVKALLADAKAREALSKHIPLLAAFLLSGQAEGLVPDATTLDELARSPDAQQAGLTADALKKINEDLAR